MFGVPSFFESLRPSLKGEFIGCGLVLSHLWGGRGNAYANLRLPSLHIKQLISSFIVSVATRT